MLLKPRPDLYIFSNGFHIRATAVLIIRDLFRYWYKCWLLNSLLLRLTPDLSEKAIPLTQSDTTPSILTLGMPFLISGIPQRGAPGPYCFDLYKDRPALLKRTLLQCIVLRSLNCNLIRAISCNQWRTKWRNCRLTTKNPDYQLGCAILAECRHTHKRNFHFI